MRTILAVVLVLVASVEWATAGARASAPPVPDVRALFVGDRLVVVCDHQSLDQSTGRLSVPAMTIGVDGRGYFRLKRRKRVEVGNQVRYAARGKGNICNVTFTVIGGEPVFTDLYLRMKGDPFDLYGDGANGTDVRVRTLIFRGPAVTRATVDGADVVLFPRQ